MGTFMNTSHRFPPSRTLDHALPRRGSISTFVLAGFVAVFAACSAPADDETATAVDAYHTRDRDKRRDSAEGLPDGASCRYSSQ